MEEKKDWLAWLKRSDHNYFIPFVIIVTAVVAVILLFLSHNSVLKWVKAGIEVQNQEKEMATLKAEIKDMDAEIEALTTNRDSLETFARETYHFAAPGEDVYIVE